jgi:multidrug resistance efflux pump
MFVSEDGYVTGSVDVSKLDEIEPKSDEAKARLEQLKAEAKASQEGADADAERLAKLHEAQSIPGQVRAPVTTQAAQPGGEPDKAEAPKAPATKSASKSASSSDKG